LEVKKGSSRISFPNFVLTTPENHWQALVEVRDPGKNPLIGAPDSDFEGHGLGLSVRALANRTGDSKTP
tara:strand:+ start:2165 stop:2371 length:207 start_codon:yes stop_codon:yes gene_type:complete